MKNTVLFCTGLSGSGKSTFIRNYLPDGAFHSLKSATTRPMRETEQEGREYYFRDEEYFEREKFVTHLFVNQALWTPGTPKWLYGVPEFEVFNNYGTNFTYDVIEPKYVRQMIDWFRQKGFDKRYDFKVLWFLPSANHKDIVKSRQNMPNDIRVREMNTCNVSDFERAGVKPNHIVICNPQKVVIDNELKHFIANLRSCR